MPPKRKSKKRASVSDPQGNEIVTPTGPITISEYLLMNDPQFHCKDAKCNSCLAKPPTPDIRELSPQPHYVSKSKFSRHLFCPVCMEVLSHPVRLFCGHVYCAPCSKQLWQMYVHTGSSTCPLDRIGTRWELVHFDLLAKKLLAAQLVYCPNRKNSCKWEGLKRNQDDHASSCSYKELPDWLKAIKRAGEDENKSTHMTYVEDEELAEILEREVPDVDLMTRMYFKDQNLVNNALGAKFKAPEKIEEKPPVTKRKTKNSKRQ